MIRSELPVVGFAAYSGTGKTTLLEQLIPLLTSGGVRLAMIKHAHHEFDIDQPGKDSYRLRKAGAQQMLIASSKRWALMHEHPRETEADLQYCLERLDTRQLDLIMVEGFKSEDFPKIELHRPSLGKDLIYPQDENIVAIASDQEIELERQIPLLDLNVPASIANFIFAHFLGRSLA
ncbi:MAG: molybdopterin-guanine dinucleotide biosynthesis protein B [Gammaproteobacteria bacterium]|nr:molybdopterin-guanine dinucleotide biosynthesis protein B [Gammaproteobacteria bacterium]